MIISLYCAQVPCDPKMLVAVLQPETLSQFNITSMEQEMRQKDLILDGGVGISLSLLDTERFAVPDVLPALDQEDAALLSVCFYQFAASHVALSQRTSILL